MYYGPRGLDPISRPVELICIRYQAQVQYSIGKSYDIESGRMMLTVDHAQANNEAVPAPSQARMVQATALKTR